MFEVIQLGVYRRIPFLLWQQTQVLCQLKADWYLSTFFLPLILPCSGAVMVHDLSFRAHPEYFPRTVAWYMTWLTRLALRQARRILTISEFSRQELSRFYSVPPEQVVNLYGGVDDRFRSVCNPHGVAQDQQILAKYGVTSPYIFALGNIHPRKNLVRLLEAYLILQSQRTTTPAMVWGGLQRWDSHNLVQQAQQAGVILPGFIEQADLPAFFRQAEMLVYPSLYEGLGLPPLEAMACGTPAIVGNVASLPEVVGQAALLVNPLDINELAFAMACLLDDLTLRKQLVEKGLQQVKQFTWLNTADRLLTALTETKC
jgi:glycosyltransferase involved in cell wall biosynthesis